MIKTDIIIDIREEMTMIVLKINSRENLRVEIIEIKSIKVHKKILEVIKMIIIDRKITKDINMIIQVMKTLVIKEINPKILIFRQKWYKQKEKASLDIKTIKNTDKNMKMIKIKNQNSLKITIVVVRLRHLLKVIQEKDKVNRKIIKNNKNFLKIREFNKICKKLKIALSNLNKEMFIFHRSK